jgi:hypothetical protein
VVRAWHRRGAWLGDIKPSNVVVETLSALPCVDKAASAAAAPSHKLYVIDLEGVVVANAVVVAGGPVGGNASDFGSSTACHGSSDEDDDEEEEEDEVRAVGRRAVVHWRVRSSVGSGNVGSGSGEECIGGRRAACGCGTGSVCVLVVARGRCLY